MTASTADPMANALLDFIAIKESGGNYDAYIGALHPPAGYLTGRNFGQIDQFQRELISRGNPSSAVGRYQFIHATLGALKTKLGYSDTTLFDAPHQDAMGMVLLQQRGYQRWLDGNLDDETFLHQLSCEWASLPDPLNGGKSHYDGDSAGNHAGQTVEACYAVFNAPQNDGGTAA